MNAGAATWMTPMAVPNSVSTASTTRIPGASSGPSQPTLCGSPRQRREACVTLNASAPPALHRRRHEHRAAGDVSATMPATSTGALITDTSNTIETSA